MSTSLSCSPSWRARADVVRRLERAARSEARGPPGVPVGVGGSALPAQSSHGLKIFGFLREHRFPPSVTPLSLAKTRSIRWSIELRLPPILGAPGAREGSDGIRCEP